MLSRRVHWALKESLKSGLESEVAGQRERMETLEGRLAALKDRLASAMEGIGEAVRRDLDVLRSEYDSGLGALEKLLERIAAGETVKEALPVGGERAPMPSWRLHPGVVTPEAEPGEEDVYGDAAPLVAEWRNAVEAVRVGREGVAGLDARARLLQLELEMLGTHKVTLPPRTHSWDGFDRRQQV